MATREKARAEQSLLCSTSISPSMNECVRFKKECVRQQRGQSVAAREMGYGNAKRKRDARAMGVWVQARCAVVMANQRQGLERPLACVGRLKEGLRAKAASRGWWNPWRVARLAASLLASAPQLGSRPYLVFYCVVRFVFPGDGQQQPDAKT
jgi:hypothetical protein